MRTSSRKMLILATLAAASRVLLGASVPASSFAENQPPDTIILKGSPMGGVKFEHKLHVERAANKCETCHHASKVEKPAKAPQEACMDCHTKPPQPGMKTGTQGAFHNPAAQTGTCIDCHKQMTASGKKAPTKCMECHKKENG